MAVKNILYTAHCFFLCEVIQGLFGITKYMVMGRNRKKIFKSKTAFKKKLYNDMNYCLAK